MSEGNKKKTLIANDGMSTLQIIESFRKALQEKNDKESKSLLTIAKAVIFVILALSTLKDIFSVFYGEKEVWYIGAWGGHSGLIGGHCKNATFTN